MIKIYFKHRFILLSKHKAKNLPPDSQTKEISSSDDIKVKINTFISNNHLQCLNLTGKSPEHLLILAKESFSVIIAGGGIVKNPENKILFIFRKGKWDLPKGKAEKEEAPEYCALREVAEECSIDEHKLQSQGLAEISYHMYNDKGKFVIKETHWFNMYYSGDPDILKPQTEEDISECRWVNKKQVNNLLENTFPSIKDISVNHILNT